MIFKTKIFTLTALNCFQYLKTEITPVGETKTYEYYPTYLNDIHYTLLIFDYHKYDGCDFRLYIHDNKNNLYVKCIFDISDSSQLNIDLLDKKISDIFSRELISAKIKKIKNNIKNKTLCK